MPPRNEAKTTPQQIADLYEEIRRLHTLVANGGSTASGGEPGERGPAGADGAPGTNGSAGPTGPTGPTGQVSWSRAFAVMGS